MKLFHQSKSVQSGNPLRGLPWIEMCDPDLNQRFPPAGQDHSAILWMIHYTQRSLQIGDCG